MNLDLAACDDGRPFFGVGGCCVWLVFRGSLVKCFFDLLWSSFQGRMVDALASGAEEGRGNLR